MALVRRQDARSRPAESWNLANFRSTGNVFDEFDQLFNQLASPIYSQAQWAQGYPVDLYETAEDFVVEMAVPGVNVEDLDITLEGRQLSIRGTLPQTSEEGRRYWMQSIPHGEFRRTVSLPATVDVEHVQASVQNGLLVVRMPKVAEARARKIAISNA